MEFDLQKLRGRIIEKYRTLTEFSAALKVSKITLSKKMNNKTKFSADDIVKIANLLEISEEEICKYFFTPKV